MTEHTPTPWVGFSDSGRLVAIMPAGREGDICTFEKLPSNPDGDFILKAVNNHDALVKALTSILRFCDAKSNNESPWERAVTAARGVLIRVERTP